MRIAILIPSRNRPRMLSAVITALHEMESGENEVEYRVGTDFGDDETSTACIQLGVKNCIFGEETLTIGAIWNELAKPRADIYSCMIDDAFPISPHWDKAMAVMAKQYDAFSWYEVSAPHNVGYPTCTRAWIDKIGYIVPDHFPFWFSDTWFSEMVHFITNEGVPVHQQLALYSKQEATQNMRDLDFWWGVFNATRIIRLKESHSIGAPELDFKSFKVSRKRFIDVGNARDREFRGERIARLEDQRGSKSEPSTKYLLAKECAKQYLLDNNLSIWCNLDA